MEITLAALADAGIELVEALRAYFLLTNFTLGQVSYEIEGPSRALDPAEAVRCHRILGEDFPHVERLPYGERWDFDAAFEFGLTVILRGLECQIH